jgi:hypothetical protein
MRLSPSAKDDGNDKHSQSRLALNNDPEEEKGQG